MRSSSGTWAGRNFGAIFLIAVLVGIGAIVVAWLVSRSGGEPDGSLPEAAEVISSDESGTITSPSGATLEIPVGAVPLTQDGAIGQIVVTMDETTITDRQANLPAGLSLASTAIEIGPDFQTLASPAMLTLPVPADIPIDLIGGLTWFDTVNDQWVMVPARVDAASGTVAAEITHFSMWSWWQEADAADRRWKADNGGYVEVSNYVSYSPQFPTAFFGWGDNRASYTSYGVCVDAYYAENESLRDNTWWRPTDWMMMQTARPASDFVALQEGTSKYWLPEGQYEMREVIFFSEMNRSPLYVPAYGYASRPLGTILIASGGQVQHTWKEEDRVSYPLGDDGWVAGRPACAGQEMPAPGHGDMQVQLIWPQVDVDLDLHIAEPNGFEISYTQMSSPSGGWLDHDNQNGAGIPENVYWNGPPSGTYTVDIVYYAGAVPANWTIRTISQGRINLYTGTIAPSSGGDKTRVRVTEIRVP